MCAKHLGYMPIPKDLLTRKIETCMLVIGPFPVTTLWRCVENSQGALVSYVNTYWRWGDTLAGPHSCGLLEAVEMDSNEP